MRGQTNARCFPFGFPLGFDQGNLLLTLGLGHLSGGLHGFHGFGRFCAGQIGGCAGAAFFLGFLLDDNLTFLIGDFQFTFLGDFRGANGLFTGNPRPFGFTTGIFAACGDFGLLRGAQRFHLLRLFDARLFFVLFDDQLLALGLHRGAAHGDVGFGVDGSAFFLGQGNHLGQFAHTNGVKGVVFIQSLEGCLVQRGQRDGFKRQTVLQQVLGYSVLHFLNKDRAVFMQFVHRHLGRNSTQTVDQFTFDHFA